MKNFIILFSLLISSVINAGPGDTGGGGPGMHGDQLLSVQSFRGDESQVYTIKDVVDVRLVNDEVLDLEQLRDRFGQDVLRVGDELRLSKKIPVVDFQNIRGEVRQIQQFQKIQH